eukprot:COSAG04_NODE_1141_length_8089_cov_510.847935_1_plen_458_part_00
MRLQVEQLIGAPIAELGASDSRVGPSAPPGAAGLSGWRAAVPAAVTYARGGLVGCKRPRAPERPRIFYRPPPIPAAWDAAAPRTAHPRAREPASAARLQRPATARSPLKPPWAECTSRPRGRALVTPRRARAPTDRVFDADSRSERERKQPRRAQGGEWVPGLRNRGAPGWADATCRRSRGRLRRSSAPPPPSPSLRGAGDHAVQGLAAPELQAMLSLGAARLESTIHALDESKRRARLQQAQERREAAVLLIQSHWRGGLRRRIVQEMQWAATIVQANARSHSQCRVFQLKRLSVLGIQAHARGRSCRMARLAETNAAIEIQCRYRGWCARKDRREKEQANRELLLHMAELEQRAAARMQAVYRGMCGRRRARAARLRALEEAERLGEIEREHREAETKRRLARQASAWQREQEHQELQRQMEEQREAERQSAAMGKGAGVGTVVRQDNKDLPGFG